MTSRRVIINADDLGFATGVTDGILEAHRRGVLTSATLAANMPDAVRAVELCRGLPGLGVGIHLNACQGPPLSEAALALAGPDGLLNFTGPRLALACLCRRGVAPAVLAEFQAQIEWVLSRGLRPTHLDSHRHVHALPSLWRGVTRLARQFGVRYVRWPSERLPGRGWQAPPRKQARVARLLRAMCLLDRPFAARARATGGTWGIAHTGQITPEWLRRAAAALPPGVTEIMVHPGRIDGLDSTQTRLIASRQAELDALCDPSVADAFNHGKVTRVHYGNL